MEPAFDHIAIAARSLDEGAAWLRDRLGIMPEAGGKHALMGTHNMLLSLGPGEYLELIAIDPDAPEPPHPRWFGLDSHDGPPALAGWVLREAPLRPRPGTRIAEASRGSLCWRITLPDAGQMPLAGAVPMGIDWGNGGHPSGMLQDHGLRLAQLTLPLDTMPIADRRILPGPAFSATIATPAGMVAL